MKLAGFRELPRVSMRKDPLMPRCITSTLASSKSASRYLARRPSPTTRRPSSCVAKRSGSGKRRSGRFCSTSRTTPTIGGLEKPRRTVSTSGSSGMASHAACVVLLQQRAGWLRKGICPQFRRNLPTKFRRRTLASPFRVGWRMSIFEPVQVALAEGYWRVKVNVSSEAAEYISHDGRSASPRNWKPRAGGNAPRKFAGRRRRRGDFKPTPVRRGRATPEAEIRSRQKRSARS